MCTVLTGTFCSGLALFASLKEQLMMLQCSYCSEYAQLDKTDLVSKIRSLRLMEVYCCEFSLITDSKKLSFGSYPFKGI